MFCPESRLSCQKLTCFLSIIDFLIGLDKHVGSNWGISHSYDCEYFPPTFLTQKTRVNTSSVYKSCCLKALKRITFSVSEWGTLFCFWIHFSSILYLKNIIKNCPFHALTSWDRRESHKPFVVPRENTRLFIWFNDLQQKHRRWTLWRHRSLSSHFHTLTWIQSSIIIVQALVIINICIHARKDWPSDPGDSRTDQMGKWLWICGHHKELEDG
jgi:hypothetical protein